MTRTSDQLSNSADDGGRVWVRSGLIAVGLILLPLFVYFGSIGLFVDSLGHAMWLPAPFLVLGVATAVWVAFGSWKRARGWARVFGITGALLLAGILTPWNPRKLFVFNLSRIDAGMHVDEVEEIMGGYMKGRGAKWTLPPGAPAEVPGYPTGTERAIATGSMTYRWSDTSFDSDWGLVTFRDGRVTEVRFLPD